MAAGVNGTSEACGHDEREISFRGNVAGEGTDLDRPHVAANGNVGGNRAAECLDATEITDHGNATHDVVGWRVVGYKVLRSFRIRTCIVLSGGKDAINDNLANGVSRDVIEVDVADTRVPTNRAAGLVRAGAINAVDELGAADAQTNGADDVGLRHIDAADHDTIEADIAQAIGTEDVAATVVGLILGNDAADVGVARRPNLVRGDAIGVGDLFGHHGNDEVIFVRQTDKVEFADIKLIAQVSDLEAGPGGELAGDADFDLVAVGIDEAVFFEDFGAIGQTGKQDAVFQHLELGGSGRGSGGNNGDFASAARAESAKGGFETIAEVGGGFFHEEIIEGLCCRR